MKKNAGMRLSEESLEKLKELATQDKRSLAGMVEWLIHKEWESLKIGKM